MCWNNSTVSQPGRLEDIPPKPHSGTLAVSSTSPQRLSAWHGGGVVGGGLDGGARAARAASGIGPTSGAACGKAWTPTSTASGDAVPSDFVVEPSLASSSLSSVSCSYGTLISGGLPELERRRVVARQYWERNPSAGRRAISPCLLGAGRLAYELCHVGISAVAAALSGQQTAVASAVHPCRRLTTSSVILQRNLRSASVLVVGQSAAHGNTRALLLGGALSRTEPGYRYCDFGRELDVSGNTEDVALPHLSALEALCEDLVDMPIFMAERTAAYLWKRVRSKMLRCGAHLLLIVPAEDLVAALGPPAWPSEWPPPWPRSSAEPRQSGELPGAARSALDVLAARFRGSQKLGSIGLFGLDEVLRIAENGEGLCKPLDRATRGVLEDGRAYLGTGMLRVLRACTEPAEQAESAHIAGASGSAHSLLRFAE